MDEKSFFLNADNLTLSTVTIEVIDGCVNISGIQYWITGQSHSITVK